MAPLNKGDEKPQGEGKFTSNDHLGRTLEEGTAHEAGKHRGDRGDPCLSEAEEEAEAARGRSHVRCRTRRSAGACSHGGRSLRRHNGREEGHTRPWGLEAAGEVASDSEDLCRRSNRDADYGRDNRKLQGRGVEGRRGGRSLHTVVGCTVRLVGRASENDHVALAAAACLPGPVTAKSVKRRLRAVNFSYVRLALDALALELEAVELLYSSVQVGGSLKFDKPAWLAHLDRIPRPPGQCTYPLPLESRPVSE